MTECIPQLRLGFHPVLPIVVDFDAPEVSSDGGLLLLRQIDDALGLTSGFAAHLSDDRDPLRCLHSRQEQTRQRVYQIALG
jgi:DDE family transposase